MKVSALSHGYALNNDKIFSMLKLVVITKKNKKKKKKNPLIEPMSHHGCLSIERTLPCLSYIYAVPYFGSTVYAFRRLIIDNHSLYNVSLLTVSTHQVTQLSLSDIVGINNDAKTHVCTSTQHQISLWSLHHEITNKRTQTIPPYACRVSTVACHWKTRVVSTDKHPRWLIGSSSH